MHPILEQRRLWLYLLAWLPGGTLLAVLIALSSTVSWTRALALAVPLSVAYGFICLASWYPCSVAPATASNAGRLLGIHSVGALLSSSLWIFVGSLWSRILEELGQMAKNQANGLGHLSGCADDFRRLAPIFFVVGLLLYVLAVLVNYLLIAFAESREAEARALELQFQARQSEREAEREREASDRERQLARDIQRRLMPPAELVGSGYRIAARLRAAQYVGGDFYDFFRLSDGNLGLVVADVSGKGIGASLIMASVNAALRTLASELDPLDTLDRLNRRLLAELGPREFVALTLCRFEPRLGRLEIANCGLPDPYLLRADHPPRLLEVPGPRLPLGVRPETVYQSLVVDLQPGDRVLLLSDGLPEAPDTAGEPIGYEALVDLMDHPPSEPLPWLDRLIERVCQEGEPNDDLTTLMLSWG